MVKQIAFIFIIFNFPGLVFAESISMLKAGYFECDEQDILEIVDLDEPEFRTKIFSKIFQGICSSHKADHVIDEVAEKKSQKGRTYLSYRYKDMWGSVTEGTHYTLPDFITTLKDLVECRKGTYTLVIDNKHTKMAECTEGGIVDLRKEDEGWHRVTAGIFSIDRRFDDIKDNLVGNDIQRALTEGCKGVDYLNLKFMNVPNKGN